jgi:Restriction endonuclease
MNKTILIKKYDELKNKMSNGKTISEQKRGFELEKLLYDLLAYEKLEPIQSFRGKGEQIDGLFEYKNRYFLIEAKWEKNPVPASKIYSLQGRLGGKLIGCLGCFISMSGFSDDAPPLIEKTGVNVILFTQRDMDYCFDEKYSFSEVLNTKLHFAAREGQVFNEFESFLNNKKLK